MKWQTDKPLHTFFLFRYSFPSVSFSSFCALYCIFCTHTSDKITCFTTQFYTMVIHQSYKGESCKQDSPPAADRFSNKTPDTTASMIIQKKTGTAGFLLPCVPIDMLLIRFKLKHLISVDFILLTMTFQSKHTLHNSQIFSCLLPMAATDINTTRFHLDPVHLHQTGILIRQTGPYPVLSCYLLGRNQFCRCHQTTVHSRRLYQLLKLYPQTTCNLPQHTQRRIGSPSLNLSQHTLTHPRLLRHLIQTHTLGFPNPLQIHRHIIR